MVGVVSLGVMFSGFVLRGSSGCVWEVFFYLSSGDLSRYVFVGMCLVCVWYVFGMRLVCIWFVL